MSFRSELEHETDLGTKNDKIYLYRYETLNEIIESYLGVPIDELSDGDVLGLDANGGEHCMSFEDMMQNIEEMALYGFSAKRSGENQIHFWVDATRVDPIDFIELIAHERGHLLSPCKRDDLQEELKADRYGTTALFAFRVARDVLGLEFKK